MKKLSLYIVTFALATWACEKDEDPAVMKTDAHPAVITTSAADLSKTVSADNLADEITLTWDETDYGIITQVNYSIQLDLTCDNFANPVELASTNETSVTFSLQALNRKLVEDLKAPAHLPIDAQVRVISKVKDQFEQVSEPLSFTVTTFSTWSKALWVLNGPENGVVYNTDANKYEGYVDLSTSSFKLTDSRTCDQTLIGGSEGILSESGGDINVSNAGYYKLNVDQDEMTYTITPISSFGIIGTATPGSWSASTPMSYNATTKRWSVTTDLAPGALKFRANDEWTINYGPADGGQLNGTLLFDDPGAISITEAGNYTVVLDMSQTVSQGYLYAITKNSTAVAPASLWIPGEYQGWTPATAPDIKATSSTTFEGYVYIGSATGFKFTSSPDWDHTNFGDAGEAGKLTKDSQAGNMGLSTPGVYLFKVDTAALTYTATLIESIGMVGPATAGGSDAGWNQSVAMTYDEENDVWTGTIDLSPGAVKFRANNEWTINYGPSDSNSLTGTLIFDDPGAIDIKEAGNYTVTVDFSRSEAPYQYTYSITKN